MKRSLSCPKCGSTNIIYVSNDIDNNINSESFYTCSNCSFTGERLISSKSADASLIQERAAKGWVRFSNKYIKTEEMIKKVATSVKSFNNLVNTVNTLAGRMMMKTDFEDLKSENLLALIQEINNLDDTYNKIGIIQSGFEKANSL